LTNATLAHVIDRLPDTANAGTARVVVRWDMETGWAHLAVDAGGDWPTRFVGFHRFAEGGVDVVAGELAAGGCVSVSAPHFDGELMEIEAVFAPAGDR
jgi:hypothetical protein